MTGAGIITGRVAQGRVENPRAFCLGCRARIRLGAPLPSSLWAQTIHQEPLTSRQIDLLLLAAAEYRDLCEACRCGHEEHDGVCGAPEIGADPCGCTVYVPTGAPDPVEFVDWVSVDARERAA